MTGRTSDEAIPLDVVGSDRSLDSVIARLRDEGSVIMVGPLGSGKSFLSRQIVSEFRFRGVEPVVVRAAVPLSSIPFGAFDAAADPRLDELRATAAGMAERRSEPLIVAIDDAHALDPESLELLSRLIYTGRVRALLSVTADSSTGQSRPLPNAITRLWIDGGATRLDLHPLDANDAEHLITAFAGDEVLDSVTRATLFIRSGGSRMLLRELVTDALSELTAGRDPLDPARELRAGSRLSDALTDALGTVTPGELLGLALLGRLRGVPFATASRSIDHDALEALVARQMVTIGNSQERRLYANPLLARVAERLLEPGLLERSLDHTAARALAEPDLPAGAAIDRLIAASWHSRRPTVAGPSEVDARVRCRILSSAARSANALGRSDLALAYVRLGVESDGCPALHVEASRAHARLGHFAEAHAELARHAPDTLSPTELRRMVRWWSTLTAWVPSGHSLDEIEKWLRDGGVGAEGGAYCEIEVQRAETACLDLDWRQAESLAQGVLAHPGASLSSQTRAAIILALTDAELRRDRTGPDAMSVAERANRDAVTGRPISVSAELAAICFQAMAGLVAGGVPTDLPERLHDATVLAARLDDRAALALAGLVAGYVNGIAAGDQRRVELELAAALDRFERIEFAVWRPLVAYMRVSALARMGEAAAAQAVFAAVDHELVAARRLYRYSRLVAEAEIVAASGRPAEAVRLLECAVRERQVGDHLDAPSPLDLERRARFLRAAAAQAGLHREVRPAVRGGLRLGADIGDIGDIRGIGAVDAATGMAAAEIDSSARADGVPADLTEREHEIALLVSHQLSNKEIAQRLYLSVRTVESHVYTARGKLGARSRRELGRIVAGAEADRR